MYLVSKVDVDQHTPLALFSDIRQAKEFARKRCSRDRAGEERFIYWVGVNKKCSLEREFLVGWYERDHKNKVVWEDCSAFCPHLCLPGPVDQLAENLMSRDPIVMDMARDILGVQDL